mgnify:CR=1 FL=1
MKRLILPLFLALVFGSFLSACKDSGGVPAVVDPLSECVEGMDCYVAPQSQYVPSTEPPAPECIVDADCASGKLCDSGTCEDIGGGEDGSGDDADADRRRCPPGCGGRPGHHLP